MAKLVHLGKSRVGRWKNSYHTLLRGQILDQIIGSAKHPLEVHHDVHNSTLRSMKLAKLMQTLSYSIMADARTANQCNASTIASFEDENKVMQEVNGKDPGVILKLQIGENLSRKEKMNFLINALLDIKDSKDAIYSALDAYVAWEQNFPIGQLKTVMLTLEKEQQWQRVIQVIKWMLSKGQGNTMGTYGQLIRALDMDHRADEAHEIWVKKIGNDLHSVPWKLCHLMISVYYRNNMMEKLVKLFKGLEAFDRKPPEKAVVQKVANAYEILGLIEERDRVMEKYKSLFSETESPEKHKQLSKKKK